MKDRFEITKIIRIERNGDRDDISNKWCDSSKQTIDRMIKQGMEDTLNTLTKGNNDPLDNINKFIASVQDRDLSHNKTMVEIAEAFKINLQ